MNNNFRNQMIMGGASLAMVLNMAAPVYGAVRCETYDAWIATATKIKAQPTQKSKDLAPLSVGDKITIIGREKGYVKIAFGANTEKIGFVLEMHVSAKPIKPITDAWVTASSMYVKAAPHKDGKKIASVFRGDQVKVLDDLEGSDFSKVYAEGKTGYVLKKYISKTPLNNNDKSIKKVMYVNTDDLNMRRTAGIMGEILGKIHKGYSVEIDDSAKEVKCSNGTTWVKCNALTKSNGQTVKRKFWVAKRYLNTQPLSSVKPEVSAPVAKPEAKPEVSAPVTKPEAKPEVSAPVTKPEAKPEVSTPEIDSENTTEAEKPQAELKPVVTEDSIEVIADGNVVDVYGNVLFTLKKGDKVTLTGEAVGTDRDAIDLSDGSYGLIHRSMIDADFHTHEEFEVGRPCNPSNLGQSLELVDYTLPADIVIHNFGCDYFNGATVIPKGTVITVALDTYNSKTDQIEVACNLTDASGKLNPVQGFANAAQLKASAVASKLTVSEK